VAGGEEADQYADDEDHEDHECAGNVKFPEQETDGHRFRILQGEQHYQNQQPQPGIEFYILFHWVPPLLKG